MADEAPKATEIPETAAAKEQVKTVPVAPPASAPAVADPPPVKAAPAPAPEPEPALEPVVTPAPAPDLIRIKMANASNGATYPGQVLTVDAETGRALIRTGEASRA